MRARSQREGGRGRAMWKGPRVLAGPAGEPVTLAGTGYRRIR
ncbi:hypothetical protein [Arthrobacter livingstonensis]|nr:hypothetical protein [Arthrobacter livingstonensis]